MNLLEALRYLAALEQHRHFGRAAQACRITQPALSNAIRALEKELGVAIVRRGRQYEGLTSEGEVVLAHAHRLLHEAEALRQELHGLAGEPRGTLQIGVVPTAVPVAARFVARLQALHPGIRPVLRSLSSPEIDAGLESLALDLALGYTDRPQVGARRLQVLPQYTERYFALRRGGRARAGLSFGAPLPWGAVAALPLALLTPEMHNRAIVDAAFARVGVQVQPAFETNSVLALISSLAAGRLAAVLPGALVGSLRGQGAQGAGLQACALVEPAIETPIGLMTAASMRPSLALRCALELAQDADWLADVAAHSGALQTG